MRKTVVRLLKPLHAISVENGMCCPGTPDVSCALGWIELKAHESWPVRATTVVRLRHPMTPQQRIWHTDRRNAGGSAWVLITVAGDWLLFDGLVAAEFLGRKPKSTLFEVAIETWLRTPTSKELIECLSRPLTLPMANDSASFGDVRI